MPKENDKESLKLAVRIDSVLKPFLQPELKTEAFLAVYNELVNERRERVAAR